NDIESNIGYLDWEGIIILAFYGIELNKKFYKSVYESQTEVDVVGEISSHIAVLLKQIIEEEGADFDQQAKDFVETFCLGLTYTMIDNLFQPHPLEYDVIASKVDDALHFT
ncbi:TetR-like C-terminal domain-containing protein, partial [Lactobacillus delbrueckii subsp. bulgaricus]|nr:transcriptional regulator [Lactobacillus delbrueckii subsp. bulgaricus]